MARISVSAAEKERAGRRRAMFRRRRKDISVTWFVSDLKESAGST